MCDCGAAVTVGPQHVEIISSFSQPKVPAVSARTKQKEKEECVSADSKNGRKSPTHVSRTANQWAAPFSGASFLVLGPPAGWLWFRGRDYKGGFTVEVFFNLSWGSVIFCEVPIVPLVLKQGCRDCGSKIKQSALVVGVLACFFGQQVAVLHLATVLLASHPRPSFLKKTDSPLFLQRVPSGFCH